MDGRAYVEHYVQHLTHEMKSPLAAIRGAAELLAEPDLPAPERARFLHNVQTQSERMQTLIDKLLRLAQLEHQRVLEAPAAFSAAEVLEDLEQAMHTQAARRGMVLEFSTDPAVSIVGDRFLLGLALSNLVQNALDFSPPGGRVRCTASRDGERARFCIQDQGPGVAEFAGERIFERFFSLPRPDGSPKSTGLGLVLVREIASLHGGEIRLENGTGGGAGGGALATLSILLRAPGKRPPV